MSHNRTQKGWAFFLKRCLDLFVSLLCLLLLFPLFGIIAILIKLDSPGPVFFRQVRVGYRGRPFRIWKFRTMVVDAERNGPVVSILDPRITRVGRILRLLSLDELPQLINVLKGEMSLVGPRPLRPGTILPEEFMRQEMKPGITALTAVRGRQSLDWDTRMKLDIWYVQNWSLLLDLNIILKTIVIVVLRKNVYDKDGEMKPRQF